MNRRTDVLVIGGGGAACRSAIAAADAKARVAMIVKAKLGSSGATSFKISEMSGFNVADGQVDEEDCPEKHCQDIITAGCGMADPKLAMIVAEEAPLALAMLERWGVVFEHDGEKYLEFLSCFSTRPRTHVIKGHGEIMRALVSEIKKRDIAIYEDCLVTNLMIQDGQCVGVGTLDKSGCYRPHSAGAVVLATGGAGQIFKRNMNPPDICGDGYRLAYEAGAELTNMEFMQAGIGIIYPRLLVLNAWLWAAYPRITNRFGRAFLSDYVPSGVLEQEVMDAHSRHFPFSTSDYSQYIDIAIHLECTREASTLECGVNLDFRGVTKEFLESLSPHSALRKMWPITHGYFLRSGLDITREPAQVACFAHAINGGICIDECGGTSIPGLYAAGEVTGGPHGADRLGGNMLVTCQVFGARAGSFAAKYAMEGTNREIPGSLITLERHKLHRQCSKAIDAQMFRDRLQSAAQSGLLIVRSHQSLMTFLDTIAKIREEVNEAPNCGFCRWDVWELGNLLCAGEVIARSALFRQESRGSHFREDFPRRDDRNFGRPLVIRHDAIVPCPAHDASR